ncbi:30S ribosomal protein S5 [Candidatus Parcubacteria bacterium]|nr:30S ribosomal protein S5 [Candidatus Parcubacteria bacterium]
MTDTKDTKENKVEETKVEEVKTTEAVSDEKKTPKESNKREFTKNRRQPRRGRGQRGPRSEFEQKILDIRRVTRVSKGGRKFTFSVSIVVGNKRGKIGIGTGKAGDTSFAIQKAVKDAEKNAIQIKMTKNSSIPHEVSAKYNSARVLIIPAKGRGVIAGSALRDIIELGGLKDINGKIISGSKNKLNIAKATMKAFAEIDKTVKEDDKSLKEIRKETKKVFSERGRDSRRNNYSNRK